ncbi:hypothetical protein [Notoacmeibacter marinus]|uniref:hypothetical protein n=1 Tax=Notoacmeibacter marinus TaxID=1876515 RepID=UPI0013B04C46|nr:hypothetical protein [Notoacmeibacter marinus]
MLLLSQLVAVQAAYAGLVSGARAADSDTNIIVICLSDGGIGKQPGSPRSDTGSVNCKCVMACAGLAAHLPVGQSTNCDFSGRTFSDPLDAWPLYTNAIGPRAPPLGLALTRAPPLTAI